MRHNSIAWSFDELVRNTTVPFSLSPKYKVTLFDRDGDTISRVNGVEFEDTLFASEADAMMAADSALKAVNDRTYPPVKAEVTKLLATATVETAKTVAWS